MKTNQTNDTQAARIKSRAEDLYRSARETVASEEIKCLMSIEKERIDTGFRDLAELMKVVYNVADKMESRDVLLVRQKNQSASEGVVTTVEEYLTTLEETVNAYNTFVMATYKKAPLRKELYRQYKEMWLRDIDSTMHIEEVGRTEKKELFFKHIRKYLLKIMKDTDFSVAPSAERHLNNIDAHLRKILQKPLENIIGLADEKSIRMFAKDYVLKMHNNLRFKNDMIMIALTPRDEPCDSSAITDRFFKTFSASSQLTVEATGMPNMLNLIQSEQGLKPAIPFLPHTKVTKWQAELFFSGICHCLNPKIIDKDAHKEQIITATRDLLFQYGAVITKVDDVAIGALAQEAADRISYEFSKYGGVLPKGESMSDLMVKAVNYGKGGWLPKLSPRLSVKEKYASKVWHGDLWTAASALDLTERKTEKYGKVPDVALYRKRQSEISEITDKYFSNLLEHRNLDSETIFSYEKFTQGLNDLWSTKVEIDNGKEYTSASVKAAPVNKDDRDEAKPQINPLEEVHFTVFEKIKLGFKALKMSLSILISPFKAYKCVKSEEARRKFFQSDSTTVESIEETGKKPVIRLYKDLYINYGNHVKNVQAGAAEQAREGTDVAAAR